MRIWPDKFVIAFCEESNSNLFLQTLKEIPVSSDKNEHINSSNPCIVLIPVPTAVPPIGKSVHSFIALLTLTISCFIIEAYPENSWPNLIGVASWRCVRPTLIIAWNSFDFFNKAFSSISRAGIKLSSAEIALPTKIAVGNVSFVDWDIFTWSFGCTNW